MNFFSSDQFLNVVSEVYFKGRSTRIEDVVIADKILRLLVIDGESPVTKIPFLDYHQPIRSDGVAENLRKHKYAHHVATRVVPVEQWTLAPGTEAAPFIEWGAYASFEEYISFLSCAHKKQLRQDARRRRRLEEFVGALVFSMNDHEEDVLDFAFRWKSNQLIQSSLFDFTADRRNLEFFRTLRNKGLLTSASLRASGRLLAVSLGFIHDSVWSGWISTYDPEFRKYAVGHQLLMEMLKKSHQLGHREFDLSVGTDQYKFIYATHVRILGSIGETPLSDRLRAILRTYPKLHRAARRIKFGLGMAHAMQPGSSSAPRQKAAP
jgi:hypothetical protein